MCVSHDGQLAVLVEQNITVRPCRLLLHWTWNRFSKVLSQLEEF